MMVEPNDRDDATAKREQSAQLHSPPLTQSYQQQFRSSSRSSSSPGVLVTFTTIVDNDDDVRACHPCSGRHLRRAKQASHSFTPTISISEIVCLYRIKSEPEDLGIIGLTSYHSTHMTHQKR